VLPEDDIRYVETCRSCESVLMSMILNWFKIIYDILSAFVGVVY
jgi:hypothetical protein